MDLVSGLPKTMKGCDVICFIMDKLTKSAHLILIRLNHPLEKLVELYIKMTVSLHGITFSIVYDRDLRPTSRFWESLHKDLGTKLRLSSAYHPQTDVQMERTIQYLEDSLRASGPKKGGAWDGFLLLIEFTYNNSFHLSI